MYNLHKKCALKFFKKIIKSHSKYIHLTTTNYSVKYEIYKKNSILKRYRYKEPIFTQTIKVMITAILITEMFQFIQ